MLSNLTLFRNSNAIVHNRIFDIVTERARETRRRGNAKFQKNTHFLSK